MKFFFDNCISRKLAAAMHALVEPEHQVVHLSQKWREANAETVLDTVWIGQLAAESGWTVVSGDIHIRTRPAEREAFRRARLTTFFLADGYAKMRKWDQVQWLINRWPEIHDLAERVAPGSSFRVPKRGKIETL